MRCNSPRNKEKGVASCFNTCQEQIKFIVWICNMVVGIDVQWRRKTVYKRIFEMKNDWFSVKKMYVRNVENANIYDLRPSAINSICYFFVCWKHHFKRIFVNDSITVANFFFLCLSLFARFFKEEKWNLAVRRKFNGLWAVVICKLFYHNFCIHSWRKLVGSTFKKMCNFNLIISFCTI